MQTSFLIGYSHHEVIYLRFWLLWRDDFAKHLLTNRKLRARTSPTFLASYFRCELFLVSWCISILEVVEIFGNPKIIHYTLFSVSRRISILEVVEIFGSPKIIHYTLFFWSLNASVFLSGNFQESQNYPLYASRSHEPDTPTKFLACYFRRELFWSLDASF